MTKRAELFDKIVQISTDGQFTGLNAFALSVNLIEGITDTNIIDVPNIGYLIDNLSEKYLDDDLIEDIERIVPNFVENLTGLDQILQANSDPSGYLAQGFDFSNWLLGDLGMAREVDYGLRPATEQIRQQQIDYITELLGPELAPTFLQQNNVEDSGFFENAIDLVKDTIYGTQLDQLVSNIENNYVGTGPRDLMTEEEFKTFKENLDSEPSFFSRLMSLAEQGLDAVIEPFSALGGLMEDIGFYQQYYLGGALPRNLLNLVGAASLGMPIGTFMDVIGGALAPSGQDLSDYLYSKGIDPTTATQSDIGKFLVDEGYDVPNFNYQTGTFNELLSEREQFFVDAGSYVDNGDGTISPKRPDGTLGDPINYNEEEERFEPVQVETETETETDSSSAVDTIVSGIDLTPDPPTVNLGAGNETVVTLTPDPPTVDLGAGNEVEIDLTDNDPAENDFNFDRDGDGIFDTFISNLGDFAGDDTLVDRLLSGELSIVDGVLEVGTGILNEAEDVADGIVAGTDGDGDGDVNQNPPVTEVFETNNNEGEGEGDGEGEGNENATIFDENYGNGNLNQDQGDDDIVNTADPGIITTPDPFDGNDIITTPTDMSDNNEYDAAYETAKFILGASEAERFRGVGLANEELQKIIGDYSSMVGQSELERLLELNRGEQAGINELRDIQKASDLELLGEYGQEYADAIRGLDPTALGILGQQKELSDRLYRRAAGDLTEEELADAEERAFEVAATTGRTMDSTRIANVLRAEEDMRANLEARAQQAGTSAYNMSRNLTGNIPAVLLGNTGNPYGTGVGQVTPPLGIGDVISLGTQQFTQRQNIQQAQRQLDAINRQYDQAVANNEPSKAQELLARADEIVGYISLASQGLEALGNLPQTVRNVRNSFSNAVQGVKTLFSGGSTAPAFNPNSRFNYFPQTFDFDDYINEISGTTFGGGSSQSYFDIGLD